MEKDMKSYPNNLLRQIFLGDEFDNLADDSGIALDYVIFETMSESDALLLKMRYKENMTYADIDEGIEVLDLSVRCYNVLRRANIKTVRDLVDTEPEKIYNLPNLGRKSLEELLDVLFEKGFAYKSMEIWRSYEGGL